MSNSSYNIFSDPCKLHPRLTAQVKYNRLSVVSDGGSESWHGNKVNCITNFSLILKKKSTHMDCKALDLVNSIVFVFFCCSPQNSELRREGRQIDELQAKEKWTATHVEMNDPQHTSRWTTSFFLCFPRFSKSRNVSSELHGFFLEWTDVV